MNTPTVVAQVLKLKQGQAFSRSKFLPFSHASPTVIMRERRRLVSYLTPVVARARELGYSGGYTIHTVASFTKDYDVIVTGVIVLNEEDEL